MERPRNGIAVPDREENKTPSETLAILCAEQEQETQSSLSSGSEENFIDRYLASSYYQDLRRAIFAAHLKPQKNTDLPLIDRRARGRFFEELTYFYLLDTYQGPGLILSPQRTARFFHKLYEGRELDTLVNDITLESLEGVTIPDMVIVEDGQVREVYEVTTRGEKEYFDKKKDSFDYKRLKFPEFFTGSRLHFFIPQDTVVDDSDICSPTTLTNSPVDVSRLPVNHRLIRTLTEKIKNNAAHPLDADVYDLQATVRRIPLDSDARWDARYLAYKKYRKE